MYNKTRKAIKPHDLTLIKIDPVNIGLTIIAYLEIDLNHINYGLDISKKTYNKKARSNFTDLDIVHIFDELNGSNLK